VSHATSEPAEQFHFLCLAHLGFQGLLLLFEGAAL
jgi:hypothetical protein